MANMKVQTKNYANYGSLQPLIDHKGSSREVYVWSDKIRELNISQHSIDPLPDSTLFHLVAVGNYMLLFTRGKGTALLAGNPRLC